MEIKPKKIYTHVIKTRGFSYIMGKNHHKIFMSTLHLATRQHSTLTWN